jgi:putative tricarboxylic transport membrane protein
MRRAWLVAAPLAGAALSVVLLGHTRGLGDVAQPGQLGPAFWPRLVLAGLGLACLAKLVGVLRAPAAPLPATVGAAVADPVDRRRLALGVALIALYVVATPHVGFPLATLAFVAAFMRVAGARSAGALVTTAGLTTVAVLYVFVKVVYLPLPKGGGPMESVTIGLYRTLGIF